MSGSDELKTLSKRKQRLSLGEATRKRKHGEKEAKKVNRTSVIRPNGIEWPEYKCIDGTTEIDLLNFLKALLEPMKFRRNVPLNEIRKVEAGKRSTFRREWIAAEAASVGFQMSKYFALRSSIALGVNCVSKGLENKQLVGVVIEKNVNPPIITKLLIPIAEAQGVPIVAVDGLNTTFKTHSGMRCIAFGLKRQCSEITHHFHPLVELIQSQQTSSTPDIDNQDVASTALSQSMSVSLSSEPQDLPSPKRHKFGTGFEISGKEKKVISFQSLKIRKLTS